ncbi:hypothetical protein ACMA5I_11060 [Paracoccaceae bacterium GXU_MW_L88]
MTLKKFAKLLLITVLAIFGIMAVLLGGFIFMIDRNLTETNKARQPEAIAEFVALGMASDEQYSDEFWIPGAAQCLKTKDRMVRTSDDGVSGESDPNWTNPPTCNNYHLEDGPNDWHQMAAGESSYLPPWCVPYAARTSGGEEHTKEFNVTLTTISRMGSPAPHLDGEGGVNASAITQAQKIALAEPYGTFVDEDFANDPQKVLDLVDIRFVRTDRCDGFDMHRLKVNVKDQDALDEIMFLGNK